MSVPELVCAHSEHRFTLISHRIESVRRMYFQCSPDACDDNFSDDHVRKVLLVHTADEDGFRLRQGPITEKTVPWFRSLVQEPKG